MKAYLLAAACILAMAGCQKRDTDSTGGTSSTRDTGSGQSSSYSRAQTNSAMQRTTSVPQTGMASQSRTNNLDRTGLGTPGATTQQGTQSAQNQAGGSSDQALTSSVKASLQTGVGSISSDTLKNIQVTTSSGRVTLKGTVNSDAEKQEIEKQIKQLPGVQSVDNQLTVGQGQETRPQGQKEGQPQSGQATP
jgi:osmotically-inducible protein OsmY